MAPSWLVVTAILWLKDSGDDWLRGTSHPAVSCPVLPISHHLLPQIQPDGVTLKYNEYAWNKVQALLFFVDLRRGGREPVPPALSMEPMTAAPLPPNTPSSPLLSSVLLSSTGMWSSQCSPGAGHTPVGAAMGGASSPSPR